MPKTLANLSGVNDHYNSIRNHCNAFNVVFAGTRDHSLSM